MAGSLISEARIQLQEFGVPKVYPAELIDLNALAVANKQWMRILGLNAEPLQATPMGDGLVSLRAIGVTGVIRIGAVDVEIAPKFLNSASGSWQNVLWRILGTVEGGHIDENATSAGELATEGLPDLLAEMFLSSFFRGGARGLPRRYLPYASEGPVLRGTLDIARIGHLICRPWSVPFVTDVLTDDTPLARLLRWAADQLSTVVRSSGRARELREVVSMLSHIYRRPPHLFDAQRIALDTQHRGLEPARLVGVLLLESRGIHHDQGDRSLSGFLWNSDTVYENYIFWLCRRAAGRLTIRTRKSAITFGSVLSGPGTKLTTTPDIVFSESTGRNVAIMDAKYKIFRTRPKAPDTYQILTAAHVMGCRNVSLTYPVDSNRERTVWRVESGLGACDVEMSAIPLNLMALEQIGGQNLLLDAISEWLIAGRVNRLSITKDDEASATMPVRLESDPT